MHNFPGSKALPEFGKVCWPQKPNFDPLNRRMPNPIFSPWHKHYGSFHRVQTVLLNRVRYQPSKECIEFMCFQVPKFSPSCIFCGPPFSMQSASQASQISSEMGGISSLPPITERRTAIKVPQPKFRFGPPNSLSSRDPVLGLVPFLFGVIQSYRCRDAVAQHFLE